MAYRQLRKKETIESTPVESQLSPEQVAAYLRQSSTFQVLNNQESADMQLSGAQRFAISQGLDADKIVVAHEGKGQRGVSGTLRIDQREELRETVAGIKAGTIKVVWAYSVSRLFRDKHGVQVATFIEVCAQHAVKVVIETAKTFDFSNSFEVLMFQFLANVAARENEDRSKLLHEANSRRTARGFYGGRPLVVGFIVDRDKHSPTFGRFIPYEPHAKVVRRLYKRYRELGGRFNVLAREVAMLPYVFDEFEDWVDQRDKSKLGLKRVPDGYHIGKKSLFHMLTAVEYAGYWKHDGVLLTDEQGKPKLNHEAIVPVSDWEYAFNRLSFVTLTGENNASRANGVTWTQKSRVEPNVLLKGILVSPLGTVQFGEGAYRVVEKKKGMHGHRANTLSIDAKELDAFFLERLLERVQDVCYGQTIRETLSAVRAHHAQALVSTEQQLVNIDEAIEQAEMDKRVSLKAKDETGALNAAEKLADLRVIRANILAIQEQANTEESEIAECLEKVDEVTEEWGEMSLDTRKRFIRLITESISVDEYSSHFLCLTIVWRGPFSQVDEGYVFRADGSHQTWSTEDETDLARLYPLADRKLLLERFPTRAWTGIYTWALRLGLERQTRLNTSDVPRRVSLLDWKLISANCWEYEEKEWQGKRLVQWCLDVRKEGECETLASDEVGTSLARTSQLVPGKNTPLAAWVAELNDILGTS